MPSQPEGTISREERVIAAASKVFLRYGYARTTMGDIAEHAGISRPALYLVFSSKEDVFAAVVQRWNAEALAGIRAVLPKLATLKDRVVYACQTWGAHGIDLIAEHPDSKDLWDLSFVPVQRIYGEFQALIVELLAEPAARSTLGFSPEELARALAFAMRGLEETAADGAEMRRLIAMQVILLLEALDNSSRR